MHMTSTLKDYANQHHLNGITPHTLEAISQHRSGYSIEKAKRFIKFHKRIKHEMLQHSVIKDNQFTHWFSKGEFTLEQLKYFIVQFSVFSNLFIVAQLQKTINADSLETMHASKEILVNELGVVFNKHNKKTDNQILSDEGTVEGGVFHFQAAHFEWLYKLAENIGLDFNDIGKRRHGSTETLFYCDELLRLYANENYSIAQAASFAVENWAAAGFWGELIDGLSKYKTKHSADMPIFFFTYHDKIESQHAQHTLDELEDIYFSQDIDEDLFIKSGNEMLDGVEIFWTGLNQHRLSMHH